MLGGEEGGSGERSVREVTLRTCGPVLAFRVSLAGDAIAVTEC